MITITEAARRRFHMILPEERAGGVALRLDYAGATTNNGDEQILGVYLGEPEEGDDLVKHAGEALLYVSSMVSAAFDGCVVDLMKTPKGVDFTIGPPEA